MSTATPDDHATSAATSAAGDTRDAPPSTLLRASWGAGGLGTTSMLYLINMYVLYFLVQHVGISAALAGALLASTRVYDAIIDPLIGTLSDRSQHRWGRRRPWMLVGAILCPLACIAVFNPPSLEPGYGLYAAVLASLLLYCTAYSLFAIPYVAQGAEMTDDYAARASLMAWRTFFVYASGIVITAGAPALIAALGKDREAYSVMSFAAAAVVGAAMLWVVFFTRGARTMERSSKSLPPLAQLRTVVSNRPFVIILLTKMTVQLGTAFIGASLLFFMSEVLLRGESAMALLGLVSNLVGIGAVVVWNRVLRSVERRTLNIALFFAQAITYSSWALATPAEPQWVFVLRAFMIGALGSGGVLVTMAMLADTIEYDRLKTGQRREGLFVGAFELMQTTSFVLAPLLVGLALSAAGLVPGAAGRGAQPESALQVMRYTVSIVPAMCSLIGIVLMLLYKLDAPTLARLRANAQPPG